LVSVPRREAGGERADRERERRARPRLRAAVGGNQQQALSDAYLSLSVPDFLSLLLEGPVQGNG
jgi:hypothetical protein